MHSTACGVASRGSISGLSNTNTATNTTDGHRMVLNNDDAMNKIPLKSATGLDDDEKNGGELISDTEAAEEARREQRRANLLVWMKKLTIVLICFIGIALISYVIISLCFSDWPKSGIRNSTAIAKNSTSTTTTTTAAATATNNQPTAAATATATTTTTATSRSGYKAPPPAQATAPPPQPPPKQQPTTTTTPFNNSLLSDDSSSSNNNNNNNNATLANNNNNNNSSNASNILAAGAATISSAAATTTTAKSADLEKPAVAASTAAGAATMPTIATATATATTIPTMTTTKTNVLQDATSTAESFESTLDIYEQAAVCSDKQVCSQIGSNVLSVNGSAVDAAIATMLCNGLITPQSMGIGGGLIMNVYVRKTRHGYTIDAREVAPYSAEPGMFDGNPKASSEGPLSIAVPGEVMGYHRAHERFGKLPWHKLVEPSLKLCEDGYHMSKHQFEALKMRWSFFKDNEQIRATYVNAETDEIHAIGTKLKPPTNLCDTYRLLAKNGPLDFYTGALSKLIMEDLKELGSPITPYDLEAYYADLVSSITMQLGEDTLYASPPVSSGTVVAHVLSILQGYNLTKADLLGSVEQQALTMHRFTEAFKLAFAKRWELGDLRYTDVRELVSKLTDPSFGNEQRAKINDSSVHEELSEYGAQFAGNEDIGTSHIGTLAPNGDAVAVTSTINTYFGSGLIGRRTGIVFNSGMNDFSVPSNYFNLPASPSNSIEGRKRAMSSQSPMLLTDQKGNIRLVVGASGGPKIIHATVEVAARLLWANQNIKEAIDAPRFYHQLLPNVLEYEAGRFDDNLLQLLREKGHVVQSYEGSGSIVCGIARNETAIYANADYRKRGGTAGF